MLRPTSSAIQHTCMLARSTGILYMLAGMSLERLSFSFSLELQPVNGDLRLQPAVQMCLTQTSTCLHSHMFCCTAHILHH